jgi:hypothetical protein
MEPRQTQQTLIQASSMTPFIPYVISGQYADTMYVDGSDDIKARMLIPEVCFEDA